MRPHAIERIGEGSERLGLVVSARHAGQRTDATGRVDLAHRWDNAGMSRSSPLRRQLLQGAAPERRRALEVVILGVRLLVGLVVVAFYAVDPGRRPALTGGAIGAYLAVSAVAALVVRRPRSLGALQALGGVVAAADLALVVVVAFDDLDVVEQGTYVAGLLVVAEAAIRWAVPGAMVAASALAVATSAWLVARADELGTGVDAQVIGFRVVVILVIGLLLGILVRLLDDARRLVARRLREAEFVNRFALEAPRLELDDAVWFLAESLHDQLGFERVAVLFHDAEHDHLHPAANAGFRPEVEELTRALPPDTGFSVADAAGIVSRCFRTRVPQLATDVEDDPDYIAVDPEVRSELAVPLRAGGRMLGVLVVSATRRRAFGARDARLLEVVAGELAQILENARLVELQRATIDELERLSALKDDFIAITSHELRTPLTSLRGFARALELRRAEMTPEQQDEAIQVIARQVERLRTLVEDLLAASMVDSGRQAPQLRPVALERVVDDVLAELGRANPGRALERDLPSDLPAVRADPSFARRVVTNLVANALQYSADDAPVRVAARAGDGAVRVEVVDQGPGIPEEDLPRLFDRFVRLRSQRTRSRGSGLGLYIVRGLVESMDGDVGVESEHGRGSTFWFRLPRSPEAAEDGDGGAAEGAGDERIDGRADAADDGAAERV